MTKSIFRYLSKHFSKEPKDVDRLLVSAFICKNKIEVQKNNLIKSYLISKENSNEFHQLNEFITEIESRKIDLNIETLIELFEFIISPEDRIVNGAVYTPAYIREYIIRHSLPNEVIMNNNIKIADISCGCGGFLYNAIMIIRQKTNRSFSDIFKNSVFGLDIQDYSIRRTELLLSLLAISEKEDKKEFQFNLFKGDALDFDWNNKIKKFNGFQAIVGNPPYVCSRNISASSKQLLPKWSVCSTGHPDLYIPFFQIGLENLSVGGILGFITMNTFFKSVNGRALRKYFKEKRLSFKLIDFGTKQVFKYRSTYTCICLIKNQAGCIMYAPSAGPNNLPEDESSFLILKYGKLDQYNGWNLQNNNIISKIESIGTPLGRKFSSRNGIATLKNDVYIFTPVSIDKDYFYLQDEAYIWPIERGICKDIVNPNKLVSEHYLNQIKEKIIFPYSFKLDKVEVINETFLKTEYPNAYEYLQNKKTILGKRDKGKGKKYEVWFSFGRNQSLEKIKHKLFFPHITPKIPNYLINSNEELLFYNGIAIIGTSKRELEILKKIMQSRLFWFYVTNSSKPYGSYYYSLSKNYIKNFGIYNFSKDEERYILKEDDIERLNVFFETKYGITI